MTRLATLVTAFALALAGCGDDSPKVVSDTGATEAATETAPETETDAVLPEGGEAPEAGGANLGAAARAAGCALQSFKGDSREHTDDPNETIPYSSKPPTSGKHLSSAAEDAAYETAPPVTALVHSLEHGRVVIWFKPEELEKDERADLRAFYEADPRQVLLTPDETGSVYPISATAWNREPEPNGTGRLMGCRRFSPRTFAALEAFKAQHRGKGPEAIP